MSERLPFGITDPTLVAAYEELPDKCRSCSLVLEVLGGVANAEKREAAGLDSETHSAFVLADSVVVIGAISRSANELECDGPKEDIDGPRPGCPSQWLFEGSQGRAHYGITNPAVFFSHFAEGKKPSVGFTVPQR